MAGEITDIYPVAQSPAVPAGFSVKGRNFTVGSLVTIKWTYDPGHTDDVICGSTVITAGGTFDPNSYPCVCEPISRAGQLTVKATDASGNTLDSKTYTPPH